MCQNVAPHVDGTADDADVDDAAKDPDCDWVVDSALASSGRGTLSSAAYGEITPGDVAICSIALESSRVNSNGVASSAASDFGCARAVVSVSSHDSVVRHSGSAMTGLGGWEHKITAADARACFLRK